MAWNDAIGQTTDWSALAFLNQYVDAINERIQLVGGTQVAPFQAGSAAYTPVTITRLSASVSQITLTAHGFTVGRDIYIQGGGTYHNGVRTILEVVDANNFTYTSDPNNPAHVPIENATVYLLPTDVQKAGRIAVLQSAIEDLAPKFAHPTNTYTATVIARRCPPSTRSHLPACSPPSASRRRAGRARGGGRLARRRGRTCGI